MTRRGANEGTVRQRPDGRWEARYRRDGQQRSVYGATQKEAQKALRAALDATDNALPVQDGKLTVGAYLDAWLAGLPGRVRPATAASYTATVKLYLRPHLGQVKLVRLAPDQVARMLAELSTGKGASGDPLSPTSVRYVYTVLRIALGRAVKSGQVVRNVATLVDPPAKAPPQLTPLTGEQVRHFLGATGKDRLGPLYATAVGLGLRQGELLGLMWRDVDLEAGTLSVRQQLPQRGRGGPAAPKTERARRSLVLPRTVADALREQRRRQRLDRIAHPGDAWEAGHVFTTAIGTPLDSRNVLRHFQAAVTAAKLPHQRFHDLRHACATLLIEQGEDLDTVSRILGHANLSTTADVYSHLTRGRQQRAADRMDAVLRGSA